MKTKIGISIGLMAALAYFAGIFGGWIPVLLVAGYILICEKDIWLRRSALTSVLLVVVFAVISAVINFVPEIISLVDDLLYIFDGGVSVPVLNKIVSFLLSLVSMAKKVLFVALGIMALLGVRLKLGFLDKLYDKLMPASAE